MPRPKRLLFPRPVILHPTARDYGLLIPHIKHCTKDLIPRLNVDPTERVAILRKGGEVRLEHYCQTLPEKVRFGLSWDITNGVNIDLDVSAVCLDASLQLVDTVWFRALRSKDQAVIHHGDEREGDSLGDDEMVDIYLDRVNPVVKYIGFIVNSYSGQELDDVSRSFCHLFDPKTNHEIATYAMANAASLNGFTALVMACLIRAEGGWNLRIISEAAHGKTVQDNVDELQRFLQAIPSTLLPDPEEEIDLSNYKMPETVPLEEEIEIDLKIVCVRISINTKQSSIYSNIRVEQIMLAEILSTVFALKS